MFIPGILTLGAMSSGGIRPLLIVLLVLAILLILAGGFIAVVALRKQRRDAFAVVTLEQMENEAE